MGEASRSKYVYRAQATRAAEQLPPPGAADRAGVLLPFPGAESKRAGTAGPGFHPEEERGNRPLPRKKRRMDIPFIVGLLVLTMGLGIAGTLAWDMTTPGGVIDLPAAAGEPAPGAAWTEADALLPRTADAGDAYLADTLFLGDSNTERLYYLGYIGLENMAAKRAIGVGAVTRHPCVYYEEKTDPLTIPEAVALARPRRVVMTFGTNDIADGTSQRAFIADYREAIAAIRNAYPHCDIIVNSIPPAAENTTYATVTAAKVQAYNRALLAMCAEEQVHFLNSHEALADKEGNCRAGYTIGDGLHLSEKGLEAMLGYFRTHALQTEDMRPAATARTPARRETPYNDPPPQSETPEAPA